MKSFAFLPLLTLSFLSAQAAENLRPECFEWRSRVLQVFDVSASDQKKELALMKGHSLSEVLTLVRDYPSSETPVTLEPLAQGVSDQEVSDRLNQAFGQKSCAMLTYFDLVKSILSDSKVARSKKAEVTRQVLNQVIKEEERGSLVSLWIYLGLVKTAIEQKALIVSDPLYLKLGELSSNVGRFSEDLKERSRNAGMDCTDPNKCAPKVMRAWYENLRQEQSGTRYFASEFLWLAKRMK
jgi:hypothetical protein